MKQVLVAVGAVIAVFFAWAMLRTPSPEQVERMGETLAIEECWKSQQRKSLDPGQARFIAGACEKMEADFRSKHGRAP